MLICTVRDCRRDLVRSGQSWKCSAGHTFDVARSGYVNLLQPQDRKSKNPGDTVEAVQGRRRLHDSGATQPLLAAIRDLLQPSTHDAILDAGCGEGFYLGSLGIPNSHGVDISIPAIDAAARRYPSVQWVVANADRMLPYRDSSFDVALSITARMNAGGFLRVLRPGGMLLVAIAAPDDLIELRGEGREDRLTRTQNDFSAFDFIKQHRVTCHAELDPATLQGLLHAIYRPLTAAPTAATRVTFSLDLLLYRRPL
ncbi:hypothetical protein F183_A23370 [Bryobacterales bacterium F-183]|nr:hypothetical protein F183_A23370 [Bryobacterales bacterium F-183]